MNEIFKATHSKWIKITALMAIASFTCTQSSTATCDQMHPFGPGAIFYYGVNTDFQDGIRVGAASGIDQGKDADCWFESALAAVARYPQGARLISEMITTAPGGYEVTFQDQPDRHFHVTQTEIANLHLKDQAPWADIIEAAGVKRFPAVTHGDAGDGRLSAFLGEKLNAFGLTVMTGHQSDLIETGQVSVDRLSEILQRSFEMRMAMTAGSHPKGLFKKEVVVPAHVYTILSYEPWSGVITLRNPWGKNKSANLPDLPAPGQEKGGVRDLGNGVIQLNIQTFPKYFHTVARCRVFHL